jgi:hypothetical protein
MNIDHYNITIMPEAGLKLTRKQESAIENVLYATAVNTIGKKYEPVSETDVESNVKLDSDDIVTWECFDTLPYLVSFDGIRVNLTIRPAFFPAERMYRAMADGEEDSYVVEWTGTAERCDWRNPLRIVTLDEYNAENVCNVELHTRHDVPEPVSVLTDDVPDVWTEDMFPSTEVKFYVPDMKTALAEIIDNSATIDEQYFTVLNGSTLAIAVRENGQARTGALLKTRARGLVFMEWKTGFVYRIPSGCCTKNRNSGFAMLSLSDTVLRKNKGLQNIFTARSLF